jgi:hypothetical protein
MRHIQLTASGIDAADGGIERDPAERLEPRDVLARKPGAVRGGGDVVLEHEPLETA